MPHSLRAYRRAQTGAPSAFQDPGILQLTSSLGAMLDGECPDAELPGMIEAMAKCFGTVTKTTASPQYMYVECPPPDPRWKLICIAATTFELNDGQTNPIVIELEIFASYPF